jgi:hypothetical protein
MRFFTHSASALMVKSVISVTPKASPGIPPRSQDIRDGFVGFVGIHRSSLVEKLVESHGVFLFVFLKSS